MALEREVNGSAGGWSDGRIGQMLRSPTAKRIYAVLLVLLVAFLWYNMVRRAVNGHGSQYDDFVRFSRDLVYAKLNVYREYPADYTITKYPPFFSLLFAPLVPLPTIIGASLWFWLSLGLAVGSAYLCAVTVGGPAKVRRDRALVVVPLLLTAGIIGSNLETAQVNTVTLFVVCLALYAFRQRADLAAGGLLGVATALKLTPGLFVLYFLYKRAYRVVVGAGLAVIFCWLLIPPLVFGPANFTEIMVGWYDIVSGFIAEGTLAEGLQGFRDTNQSLAAAFHRFFTEVPARWSRGGVGSLYLNVFSLSLGTADRIIKAMVLAILVFLAAICRTSLSDRGRPALSLEYSLIWIATLFVSPISWINHYVFLLFPYTVAVYYLRSKQGSPDTERLLFWAALASFVLVSSSAWRLMQAFSLPVLGAIVLGFGLSVALARERRDSAERSRLTPERATV